MTAAVPAGPGSRDSFLINADKSPNTLGATLLGLAGPDAPDSAHLVNEALQGRLDALWVFGHDLTRLFGDDTVEQLSRRLRLFIFSGTNENPTTSWSHWALPTAAYLEKDGTFVNCHGRIQRIGRAFLPLQDSVEDWRLLLDIGAKLNHPLSWRHPREIFMALAKTFAPFAGMSYDTIGLQGAALSLPPSAMALTSAAPGSAVASARPGRSASRDSSAEARSAKEEGGP